jgi:hypothetical protein
MDDTTLHRFTAGLTADVRDQIIEEGEFPDSIQCPVRRTDGSTVDLAVVDDLMATLRPRFYDVGRAEDRTVSDRWLAPRLHYALRLNRAEASDRNLWTWLAVRYSAYVTWRWTDAEGMVSEDRWTGPVHKQALMRLWWGAELFRNGADYSSAERAFIRQDLPNSYLHRPLVRCRSLALAVVDLIAPANADTVRSSDEVNDLARVLNLAMAGSPPELETDFQQDDHDAYRSWLQHSPTVPDDWDETPTGPAGRDTTEASLSGGRSIAERGWAYAVQAKDQDGGSGGRR